jgi:uncharacterized protein
MGISYFDLSVPTFLQTVVAVGVWLDKASKHCSANGLDADDLVSARLTDDMAPFYFQIECVDNYSVWGLDAVKQGVFAPPALEGVVPFERLQQRIANTEVVLKNLISHEVDTLSGKKLDMQIHTNPHKSPFTAETYLLSFLLPNFYFHAVTAYDILRTQGVPIGKTDFEGQLRSEPL